MTSLAYGASDLYAECGYADPGYVIADEFCRGGSGSGRGSSTGVPTRRDVRPARPAAKTLDMLRQAPSVTPQRARLITAMEQARALREAEDAQRRYEEYLAQLERQRRKAMADDAVNAYAADTRGNKIVVQTPKGPRLMTVEQAVRRFYEGRS